MTEKRTSPHAVLTLATAAPMRALVDATDTPIAELARRLDVAAATVSGYCTAGDRVQFSTLRRAAQALGGDIELRFVVDKP